MEMKNVAGLSMKGGRKDNFIFCLIEYYPDQSRWFLKSLLQVKDEEGRDGDEAIREWISKYKLKNLVVDFPLSNPSCHSCELDCPGAVLCEVESVVKVRKEIQILIDEDLKIQNHHPKEYERKRNEADEIDYSRDVMAKPTDQHLLSRSFKRRLKKGYLPYWNRPLDFWVWKHYYDQLLDLFNLSFDSFGSTSLMIQSRFTYLRRHFPQDFNLYESHLPILLIELLRAGIIHKRDVLQLSDIEMGMESRLDIIKKIEEHLKVFIYDHDLEFLVKNPRAFESFLLAIVGQNIHLGKQRSLPDWALEESQFVIPSF